MPRPRKAVPDHRSARIAFRVTAEEHAMLERLAASAGMGVGTYVRLRALKDRSPGPAPPQINLDAWLDLRRIGVNLNQIARALNAGGEPRPESLDQTLREVGEALGRLLNGSQGRG